jgi:uncharacterized membrane protein
VPSKSKQERRLARLGADALAERQAMAFTEIRESPLPPPAELERYEKLLPGATKLLFNNLIDQTNHRMQLENKVVNTDGKKAILGQIFAFILGMTALISGTILILNNKAAEGLAAIIAALATLMAAFFGGSLLKKSERAKKYKQ